MMGEERLHARIVKPAIANLHWSVLIEVARILSLQIVA
jgi:hypothetical protein